MDVLPELPRTLAIKLQPRTYGAWHVNWEPFHAPVWMEFHTKSLYFGDLMARRDAAIGNEFIRQPVYIPLGKLKEHKTATALRKAALLEEMLDIADGRLTRSMDRANTGAFKPEIEIRPPKLTPADHAKARFRV